MELNDYQAEAIQTAIYPKEDRLTYTVLGLVGEAGEVAEKIKKMMRDETSLEECHSGLLLELGDVLWYVANMADELGSSLDEVATLNLIKVKDRFQRNRISGSGDNR
jgi:NTP pyrophosphatase (non-canonical NTP hydrolase)